MSPEILTRGGRGIPASVPVRENLPLLAVRLWASHFALLCANRGALGFSSQLRRVSVEGGWAGGGDKPHPASGGLVQLLELLCGLGKVTEPFCCTSQSLNWEVWIPSLIHWPGLPGELCGVTCDG